METDKKSIISELIVVSSTNFDNIHLRFKVLDENINLKYENLPFKNSFAFIHKYVHAVRVSGEPVMKSYLLMVDLEFLTQINGEIIDFNTRDLKRTSCLKPYFDFCCF